MVQVRIQLQYNFDLRTAAMVPATFRGSVVLSTVMGENHELYKFDGCGGMEEAQAAATAWVDKNVLEFDNPNARPRTYLRAVEG